MTTSSEASGVLSAISTEAEHLVTIVVKTKLGARYEFPDMCRKSLVGVLPQSGRVPESVTYLMLYNYSGAMLSVPFRLVEEVFIEGAQSREDVLWTCRV